MFDLSWSELLLVGAVALVVIGPRELPRVLRTVGQAFGKMRRMAGEFQTQFNAAMREAELDEIRDTVRDVKSTASRAMDTKVNTAFDPLRQVRDELRDALQKAETKTEVPAPAPVHADWFDAASVVPSAARAGEFSAPLPEVPAPAGPPLVAEASLARIVHKKGRRVIVAAPQEAVRPLSRPLSGTARLYKATKFSALPARSAARRKQRPSAPVTPPGGSEGGQ
ncbi:sec-independent protein translocase protein TatB [Pseudochelatococcus lubricantis]|uniref:Sec-independent protein translocase protein TatB n=1 Tax=Pseudochelatococcus lubricantis TaxID=1538102 RepID=A0ABX0V0V5_9HYPH|nr:Sec-independent protein translocase protein TatB [Pseudochelatococcus lubricantis]NIJ57810.1 sec-independent protein translocase protein TatB [Pseudochelatococcus lubricantis]